MYLTYLTLHTNMSTFENSFFYVTRAYQSKTKTSYHSDDEATWDWGGFNEPQTVENAVHRAMEYNARDERTKVLVDKAEAAVMDDSYVDIIVVPIEKDTKELLMVLICNKEYRRRRPRHWIHVVKQQPGDSLVTEVVSYLRNYMESVNLKAFPCPQ